MKFSSAPIGSIALDPLVINVIVKTLSNVYDYGFPVVLPLLGFRCKIVVRYCSFWTRIDVSFVVKRYRRCRRAVETH